MFAASAVGPDQPLDPDSAGQDGARALRVVLEDHGVEVSVARSIAEVEAFWPDEETTVVITDPSLIGDGAAERLRHASADARRLVIAGISPELAERLRLPVEVYTGGGLADLRAGCQSGGTIEGDTVEVFDQRYVVTREVASSEVSTCFTLPDPAAPSGTPAPADAPHGVALVDLDPTSSLPQTTLIGFPSALTNDLIDRASHAGIAVRALGSTTSLLWYQPSLGDLTVGAVPGEDDDRAVWPRWLTPAAALLAAGIAVLAIVRGRRLGRLVPEPLPVVVRAVETTESRGRMYQRARDTGRAAAVLREATTRRLRRRLVVPPSADSTVLVSTVAHVTGIPAAEVAALLTGPDPANDTALRDLAQALSTLEEKVRH